MPITNLDDVELTGEIVLETAPGLGKYRMHTIPHHAEPADRIHLISSYNEQWDSTTGTMVKDVEGKASFHLSTESDWEGTIEWNFDHTLADDTAMRRIFGMRADYILGQARWYWFTAIDGSVEWPVGLRLGLQEPTLGSWEGYASTAALRWVVKNHNPTGGAVIMIRNADEVTGNIYMTAASRGPGEELFGLPAEDMFAIYGESHTVLGTSVDAPLHFVTDSVERGRIDADGTWYQRRDGVDHAIPHDAISWSMFRPWKSGRYYQTQPTGQRASAALNANSMYAAEFIVPRATTFDSVAIEVTTAVADSTVRLGVYADDGEGCPDVLVADLGTVDTSTAGSKTLAISLSLPPGLYWAVVAARGGSPVICTLSGGGSGMVPQAIAGSVVRNGYVAPHTADALAATFTGGSSPTTTFNAPMILVRVD